MSTRMIGVDVGGTFTDVFVLNEDMATENTVTITDYEAANDVIAIEYAGNEAPDFEVLDREEDAVIFLGGEIIARIEGGAGLTAANLRLVQAG